MVEDDGEYVDGNRDCVGAPNHLLHVTQYPDCNVKGGCSQVLVDKSLQQEVSCWVMEQGWEAGVGGKLNCKRMLVGLQGPRVEQAAS